MKGKGYKKSHDERYISRIREEFLVNEL